MKFPYTPQHDKMDCGPACLHMISRFYGKKYELSYLRDISYLDKNGVNLLNLSEAAEAIQLKSLMVKIDLDKLVNVCPKPVILHWRQDHFVVLYKIKTKKDRKTREDIREYFIADPAHGHIVLDELSFLKGWISSNDEKGIALILTPNDKFFEQKAESKSKVLDNFRFLYQYVKPHRKLILQLTLGIVLGSCISLFFPFLTQILVDVGIATKDVSLVVLILLAQLFLFLGEMALQLIRTWILLHVNTRLSINIISDFLRKMMQLPMKFFDVKSTGDITQRIHDHHRIESFLTGSTLNTLFSVINIVVVSLVLVVYNLYIFLIFFALSTLSVAWIIFFLKKRRVLDYKRFLLVKSNQDAIYEIIFGIEEIKLNGSELNKRWDWEKLQVKQFKLNIKSLYLAQYQQLGFSFINRLKNILITFMAAIQTIDGSISLGMMLSISYIIGLANGPLEQIIDFIRNGQDASLSLNRLREIQTEQGEDYQLGTSPQMNGSVVKTQRHLEGDIVIKDLSFKYGGPRSPNVLHDLNLVIPRGKVTAIVGTSGSGKTTLMKLLLKFYDPSEGSIQIAQQPISSIPTNVWRRQCGTVMQGGYLFSDTIAKNIALDGQDIDDERMMESMHISNIKEYVESLPLKYTSKIQANGGSLSEGQKQRILISRAVYRRPQFLFFDEATSYLDANNELKVMNRLNSFFEGRTVVIIAHRLSTVKNADQIVVLEKGKIIEVGNHDRLIEKKQAYYQLIKNQLELGR